MILRLPSLLLLLVVTTISACAAGARPVSAHLLDPEGSPPPACPRARFISAVGTSRTGRADAEVRARAAVSRIVASTIQADTQRLTSASRVNGQLASEQRVQQIIQETTSFNHAELIRNVGPAEIQEGVTFSLACLDRSDAAARIEADLEPDLARLSDSSARALTASAAQDGPAFAGAWREVQATWHKLEPSLVVCRAVEDGPCSAEVRARELRDRLSAEASRLRGAVSYALRVLPGDLPGDVHAQATGALHKALTSLGPTREDLASCTGARPGTIWVEVTPAANCGWGSLGHVCRPEYRVRAQLCAGGAKTVESSLAGSDLAASDARDARRALKKAVGLLTPERAREALQDALSALVPF